MVLISTEEGRVTDDGHRTLLRFISNVVRNFNMTDAPRSGSRLPFAQLLRGRRRDLDLTQAELAGALGVSQHLVSYWEGGNVVPSLDRLVDVADALGLDIHDLVSAAVSQRRSTDRA
jgi:DNA-binding XRE family transcriptional regulator